MGGDVQEENCFWNKLGKNVLIKNIWRGGNKRETSRREIVLVEMQE